MGDLTFLRVSGNLDMWGDFAMLMSGAGTHAEGIPCVEKDYNQ